MASMECDACSKALSEQEGRCYRVWHEVRGETMPPHEPLSVDYWKFECPEPLKRLDSEATS